MHAPIVDREGQFLVIPHVTRLRILADDGIVISGPRIFHGPNCHSVHVGGEEALADQPVRHVRRLPEGVLLDQRAEHVGKGLV